MEVEADEPPDGGGGSIRDASVIITDSQNIIDSSQTFASTKLPTKRLRTEVTQDMDSSHPPKMNSTPTTSLQDTYTLPEFDSDSKLNYNDFDKPPYIIHVTKLSESDSQDSLKILKFAQLLHKNQVSGIVQGGIKSIGRNKASIEFQSAEAANNFKNSNILKHNSFTANIPRFQITRMGVVKQVPTEWTLEELVLSLKCPNESVRVIKARRLNKRSQKEGKNQWVPSTTVVLTFLGQSLPERVFCYYTSLLVSMYELPVIQCRNCCRFGHVAKQCRSNARCYKCSQRHRGDSCPVEESSSTCLLCSGNHMATYTSCPEHNRQKSIKLVMSQEHVSYSDASARFPRVRMPYADQARNINSPQPVNPTPRFTSPSTPIQTSHTKTTFRTPRPRPIPGKSYNINAHNDIVSTPPSSQSNGCALTNQSQNFENSMVLLTRFFQSTINSVSDVYPPDTLNMIRQALSTLENFFHGYNHNINNNNGSPAEPPSVELQEH